MGLPWPTRPGPARPGPTKTQNRPDQGPEKASTQPDPAQPGLAWPGFAWPRARSAALYDGAARRRGGCARYARVSSYWITKQASDGNQDDIVSDLIECAGCQWPPVAGGRCSPKYARAAALRSGGGWLN